MKNIIFKSLVIGALVFGVSIVSNAQDPNLPIYSITKSIEAKEMKSLKAKPIDVNSKQKKDRVITKKAAIKEVQYFQLETAPEKKVVK